MNADALVLEKRSSAQHKTAAMRLADLAVAALIDEATLTPKPGLVDLRGGGAHKDMDWILMCQSAWALHSTFREMAEAGQQRIGSLALRERIGHIGREGEAVMMRTTGGINTHRGAIWAIGLLVTAASQVGYTTDAAVIADRAGAIAKQQDRYAPSRTKNKGEAACQQYGVGGARQQAQAGFPHVIHSGLPQLWSSRRLGEPELVCRLNALLAIMSELDDTCVLARGGIPALVRVQAGAATVLAAGGVGTVPGKQAFDELETSMIAMRVSTGGAADLLAATLLLDRLQSETSL